MPYILAGPREATTVEDKGELSSYQLELIHTARSCIQQPAIWVKDFTSGTLLSLGLSVHTVKVASKFTVQMSANLEQKSTEWQ